MRTRTVGIVAGAALTGAGVLAAHSHRPKLHERCREACAGMSGKGPGEDETSSDRTEEPSAEGESRHGCRPPR